MKDLQALPPMPAMADKIDLLERFTFLDSLQLIRRNGVGALESLASGRGRKPTPEELKAMAKIDWEPALRSGNRWYDRLVAASRLKDRVSREKELDRIDTDLKALKKETPTPATLAKRVLGKDPPDQLVGKVIGDVLVGQLLPATRKVESALDRAEQMQRNLHVAFALAGYHRDEGRYPAQLADLAPRYLPAVPSDLFSGKALVWRPNETGYLLYSVGVNGKDEEGRWIDDNPPGDDLCVRLPLPAIKLAPVPPGKNPNAGADRKPAPPRPAPAPAGDASKEARSRVGGLAFSPDGTLAVETTKEPRSRGSLTAAVLVFLGIGLAGVVALAMTHRARHRQQG